MNRTRFPMYLRRCTNYNCMRHDRYFSPHREVFPPRSKSSFHSLSLWWGEAVISSLVIATALEFGRDNGRLLISTSIPSLKKRIWVGTVNGFGCRTIGYSIWSGFDDASDLLSSGNPKLSKLLPFAIVEFAVVVKFISWLILHCHPLFAIDIGFSGGFRKSSLIFGSSNSVRCRIRLSRNGGTVSRFDSASTVGSE